MTTTISPELFFSEDKLFADDGMLNAEGIAMNSHMLAKKYEWLATLFEARLSTIEPDKAAALVLESPDIFDEADADGPFLHLTGKYQLAPIEQVLLLLALEPHYLPVGLSGRLSAIQAKGKEFLSAFGYYQDPFSGNYYPTLQTVFYLCAGTKAELWRHAEQEVIHNGKLFKEQIIVLRDADERVRIGNRLNSLIDLAPEYVDYFLLGRKPRPDFGRAFPARWVTTNLTWDHLVLGNITRSEISDVMDWVSYGKDVIERSRGAVNRSYPCLFYGPPGTGKSFAAKLIGKEYKKDVFRIDLSMIVSKYIGETEKNLAALFDRAEGKDWILFFDEADALFGKRTGISDSKDKWANLEMSYLLQRMEEYEGLCILATNLKHNLDSAMTRRFQSLIYFPWPKPEQRMEIWRKSLPPGFEYPDRISLEKLGKYDLSGAGIANVLKASCIKAAKRGDYILKVDDLSRFIRLEYAKENRTP